MNQDYRYPTPVGVPTYDVDFYSDDFIRDPYPHYAALRDLGPIVFLPQLGNYAITRFAEVREALHNWQTFSSEQAIAADKAGCEFFRGGSNLVTDPPGHDVIRVAMAAPLLPSALGDIRERVEATATELIERLLKQGSFDGMEDLARYLPVTLVTDLVGLPEDGRENMLLWAAAAFDITGVQNERGRRGVEVLNEMRDWIVTRATPDSLKPGSLTGRIRDMVASGELPEESFLGIMNDYITPSLDTTISVTGELIYRLARNPDQWALLQKDPSLIGNAVSEAVRMGSPIRSFTRRVTTECTLGGVVLPADARVMVLYASANRDERKFPDPDRFDVKRGARDHVGFGHGIHMCVGMHLATLELEAILRALVRQVERIEVGIPTIAMNNTIHAFATLPVTLHGRAQPLEIADTSPSPVSAQPTWISVRVASRTLETDDIVSLHLVGVDGDTLPVFEAGSHVDVEMASGMVRQYSLCGDPAGATGYRIGVLREAASRGGSLAVHERLHPETVLRIGRPRNFFPLDETALASVLIAGGIGITPLLAMSYRLHALGAPFKLHYTVRSQARAAFSGELKSSRFANDVTLYSDDGGSWDRFDAKRILEQSALDSHIYCCGPKGLIEHITATAEALQWPRSRIHVEHFTASPVLTGAPFTVIAQRSGKSFNIPCDRTILDVLSEAGIAIPSSCHSGVCATCMTVVLDGVPDHRDMVLTEDEKAANHRIAVCCSRSKTRQLVLDV
jgi:cytochrome P450/ferredoxin-NADP reductase